MDREGATALSGRNRPFAVAVVEADTRTRARIAQQVAGGNVEQLATLDDLSSALQPDTPAVAVFGPSLANEFGFEQLDRLTRARHDVGVIVATRELTTELLQQALRSGARDVVTFSGGGDAISSAIDRVGNLVAGLTSRLGATAPVELGRLILSFSTKGGVGKSVVSTNTAVGLARRSGQQVAIVDADLQFGDVAVMLGLPPDHTVIDAAAAVGHGDSEFILSLTSEHESGVRVLPAPVEPSSADQVRPEQMYSVVRALQEHCAYVIVDMPPHFDDLVLALLEAADDVLLIASMDIPSIKNLKVGMQTLDLLALAGTKLHLVLNRANSKVLLEISEIEQTLGMKADFQIPSDIAVPQAVNRGIPVVIDSPKSPAGRGLDAIVTWIIGDSAEAVVASSADLQGTDAPAKKQRFWRRG